MYDLLFKNAQVVDGTGSEPFVADVAVSGGKIVRICLGLEEDEQAVVDASGKILCPGFIDTHTHSDRTALFVSNPDSKILQGVTTEMMGNCGQSLAPISADHYEDFLPYLLPYVPSDVPVECNWKSTGEMLDRLDEQGHITDLVNFIGHGTVRIAAMGSESRKPTANEMAKMKDYIEEALMSGSAGMSSGLIFPPGCYADTDELVELCGVLAKHGGIYATHIRGEAGSLREAMAEAIEIARRSNCSLHISHHKVMRRFRGWSEETLKMMEDATTEGIHVTYDVYPYPAGSNGITSLLPPWVNAGGVQKTLDRLVDSMTRVRILEDFKRDLPGWDNHAKDTGWDRVLIGSSRNDPSIVGKSLQEIADERGTPPDIGYLDLIVDQKAQATIVILSHSEEDMERILVHPLGMIGSDSQPCAITGPLAKGNPHPRTFGTYPRFLGQYVRERKLLSWEDAICKATGYPAKRFLLDDRGIIREGLRADLVLFNPDTIIDRATYHNSRVAPEGIDYVIKNGQIVVQAGRTTGKVLGKSVRIRHK